MRKNSFPISCCKYNAYRTLRLLIALAACILIPDECIGNPPQWGIGVRNSRYLFTQCRFGRYFSAEVHHSLFSQAMRYQQVGIAASYCHSMAENRIDCGGSLFADTEWDGGYSIAGADISLDWRITGGWKVGCTLEPRYDTGYDFKLCYRGGMGYAFNDIIETRIFYTTIPDIRRSEKRVHMGCRITSGNLAVEPVVSIPVDSHDTIQKTRLLLSFSYNFDRQSLKKAR